MEYKVGEVVVYPHHGAAVIEDIETREMGGETLEYLVLHINQSDLVVRVPIKNADNVGVRDVVGKEGLEKVFSVVRELWRRDQDRGLSAGEKRMLGKARTILVGELALAKPVDEKKADTMMEEIDATIERHRAAGLVDDKSITTDIDNDIDLDDLSFDDED